MTEAPRPETPEHDKLNGRHVEHAAVCDFIDFIREHEHVALARPTPMLDATHAWPLVDNDYQKLIAEFFGIDYAAYQAEKEVVLKYVRLVQEITS